MKLLLFILAALAISTPPQTTPEQKVTISGPAIPNNLVEVSQNGKVIWLTKDKDSVIVLMTQIILDKDREIVGLRQQIEACDKNQKIVKKNK